MEGRTFRFRDASLTASSTSGYAAQRQRLPEEGPLGARDVHGHEFKVADLGFEHSLVVGRIDPLRSWTPSTKRTKEVASRSIL